MHVCVCMHVYVYVCMCMRVYVYVYACICKLAWHNSVLYYSVLLCRLVLFAIPACVVGVALITQPSFLGFKKSQQRNLWGVVFASSQVNNDLFELSCFAWSLEHAGSWFGIKRVWPLHGRPSFAQSSVQLMALQPSHFSSRLVLTVDQICSIVWRKTLNPKP